jgi:DnaK suppressor protein
MSPDETDRFRSALLQERKRVVEAIDYVRHEAPRAAEDDQTEVNLDNHLAEGASLTLEQEIDDTLEENAEQILAEIDQALARIEGGTYGKCETCGNEIDAERLEAIPYATQCIDCKRREEGG